MWQRKVLFLSVFSIIIAKEHTGITAFRWNNREPSDEQPGNVKTRPFLLDSLTSVAKNGASVWSNHISNEAGTKNKRSTALKQTSSMYVSQSYRQMKNSHQDQELNIDSVVIDNEDTMMEESYYRQTSHWPEHFIEEIIAFIAGGAAATSAFSALIAGTIFATVVVTVGAIVSVVVFGDEDVNYQLSNDEFRVEGSTDTVNKFCDLDRAFFQESSTNRDGIDENTFDESTMQELKKCFAGKPSAKVMFFAEPISENTCSRLLPQYDLSGFGIENESAEYVHEDNAVSSEEFDEYEEVEPPKLIELIWHDSYSTAANSYYTTRMNAKRPRRNKSNRKVAISSDQSFDLEETEREGAILLSDTFRVTSTAFGLLADAVRFAGESTAATAGGTARLVGGAVKASGWAVGSLGSAIAADRTIDEDNGLEEHSSKKRHRTRHVAGASVKLIGDAIDNVAESLLLAGSAIERVTFAAAGAAEGAVRLVEDFTSSLSSAFAREGRKGNSRKKSPSIAIESNQDMAIQVSSLPEQGHESYSPGSDDDSFKALKLNDDDILAEEFVEELTTHLLSLSTWTLQNAEYIMQDIAGVSSNAPQILFILVLMYIASVMLLNTSESKQPNQEDKIPDRIESSNEKPVPAAAGECDTHSTLTIDSTMKRDPDTQFAHLGSGTVHFLIRVALFPMKLVWIASVRVYRLVTNKKFVLLVIYLICWFFISQMSQSRSAVIERKARLAGYRDAVESVGSSLGNERLESAFWLNSVISRIWRVGVGGLEPLLASAVGSILAGKLEDSYSRPTGVAHVSLASLTFGKSVSRAIVQNTWCIPFFLN
jgi:hypothetical protein